MRTMPDDLPVLALAFALAAAAALPAAAAVKTEVVEWKVKVGEVVQAIRRIAKVVDQINQYQGGIASAVEEQSAVANEMGRGVQDALERAIHSAR